MRTLALWAVLIVYLGILLAIASLSTRSQPTASWQNYYLGNRTAGGLVLAMTLATSYTSASSFIGGPGAAYQYGLVWVAIALIQLPVAWLTLGVLGKKLAILSRHYQAITINQLLYARYQSRLLSTLTSVSLLIAFLAILTVQFIGASRLLESALGLSYGTGLLIFGITVSLYTLIGGFQAVMLTDVLQGLIMLIGGVLLLAKVIGATGGLMPAIVKLQQIDPQLITPKGTGNLINLPMLGSFWVLVGFGTLGLPQTATSCMAYKDSRAMHQAMVVGSIILGVFMLTMHLSGALGHALFPNLTAPDQIVPTLMTHLFSPVAAGLFLAAPLSAIMSTVDAQLLQCSATLIHDLYLPFTPQNARSPQSLMRSARPVTLICSLLVLWAAWHPPKLIIWLNLMAFGGLQVVFLWPLLLGLYWPKANATGALFAFVIGLSSYLGLTILSIKPWGFHPVVPALIGSLIAFMIGNRRQAS
ncbi:MAG: sodium/pantothenate symporter [Candidatus Symbiodolus clandestinus]